MFTVPKFILTMTRWAHPFCSSRTAPMPWGNLCPQLPASGASRY